MNFKERQKLLQSNLGTNRLDFLLVSHLPNIRYLCRFTGSAGILLIGESQCTFFTDGRYKQQARDEVSGVRIVVAGKNALTAAADWLRAKPFGRKLRIGIEAENLTVAAQTRLRVALPSGSRLKAAPPLVEHMRMVKDAEELTKIRAAVVLGDRLFNKALRVIHPGVKETTVAGEMEQTARQAGAERMSFPTIIASGARSALPHGQASQAVIPAKGFVVCDFGVILGGYCSDETRTVYTGRPTNKAKTVYEAVKDAEAAAVESVRSGKTAGEIDDAARRVLRRAKLARYFTHSTGHGVGLEIHEAPRIAAGQNQVLSSGMVITIEPGVYIPGEMGVRIEDMVLVTEDGCEVLTPTQKELITV